MLDPLFHINLLDFLILYYEFSTFSYNLHGYDDFTIFFILELSNYNQVFLYLIDTKLSFLNNISPNFECHSTFLFLY